mgnify:FL=1
MEKTLSYLFGSPQKLKMLRLFYRNADLSFSVADIERYTNIQKLAIKNELQRLIRTGIVNKKIRISTIGGTVDGKKSQKTDVFYVNINFELFRELKVLLMRTDSALGKKLTEIIPRLGKVKLAVLSGFFINNPESRVDILIVGDNLNRKKVRAFLVRLEAETGKSLSYSVMNSEEFKYRMNMFDRFLADILEFPHQKLVNKLNV